MITNAKINSAEIMIEDHGILTFMLYTDTADYSIGIGGYGLDYTKGGKRVSWKYTSELIRTIMEVVGVRKWSDLKGKLNRIDDKDTGGRVRKIGNILTDTWLDLDTFFKERVDGD